MSYLNEIILPESWQDFLVYKIEKQHLSKKEQERIKAFIDDKRYMVYVDQLCRKDYNLPIPLRREISKSGTSKKRVIYSYPEDFTFFLKWVCFSLYAYDDIFSDNCYAFRRNIGVKVAFDRVMSVKDINKKWCLKVDIQNYFNSIDIELLVKKLACIKEKDASLYYLICSLLKNPDVNVTDKKCDKNQELIKIVDSNKGVMAGTPISPFLANLYLSEVDHYFEEQGILYFRYSDDILIFADDYAQLMQYQSILYDMISRHNLQINKQKETITKPYEAWEFLGFCYQNGKIDLSAQTIKKMKHKIKRKAHALQRWANAKNLDGKKAAKGFITAMNKKFYERKDHSDFSWSRWFFPILNTDRGLKEIDQYMQQYIRYCVTGRHFKGNYRITYADMKKWGYRNLVHAYYQKNQRFTDNK